jgi:hypothetical protein
MLHAQTIGSRSLAPPAVSRPTAPAPTVSPPTASPSVPCRPYPLATPSPKGRVFSPLLPHRHGPPLCSLCSLPLLHYTSAAAGMSYRLHHRSGSKESTASPSPSQHRCRDRGPSLEPTEPPRRPAPLCATRHRVAPRAVAEPPDQANPEKLHVRPRVSVDRCCTRGPKCYAARRVRSCPTLFTPS